MTDYPANVLQHSGLLQKCQPQLQFLIFFFFLVFAQRYALDLWYI